jgi:streptogramin lyase
VNEIEPGDGYLRDVAMDPSNPGQVWIADNGNPAKLHLVNTATGADIRDITFTTGGGAATDFGSTSFQTGGMQIVPVTPSGQTSLTLNGVAVPAGSILLFDGVTNPDRVIAVDPSTGLIISTLILAANYDTTGGVYDPFSGHIYLIDRAPGTDQIVAIDPATGAEIASSRFNLPFNAGEAGLALDPAADGTFWYGSDQSNSVVHLSAAGTVLTTDDLSTQGVTGGTNGLSFDNTGNLLVASQYGVVYRVAV